MEIKNSNNFPKQFEEALQDTGVQQEILAIVEEFI